MEDSKRFAVMGLYTLVLLTLAADTYAQCNISELIPCLSVVRGIYPPNPPKDGVCCNAVMAANPTCLCSEFQSQNFPESYIKNALAMPRACGRTQLSGFHCGIYTIE